jgi:hypothetical protein
MPFGKLVDLVEALPEADWALPMGELAERWGEPVNRVADAIDALKIKRGKPSYISVN